MSNCFCNCINNNYLQCNIYRFCLWLFENFHDTCTLVQTCLCISVQVRAEL